MNIPITGEHITGAVCRAIKADFPDVPIYREAIDQDIKEPCFFVWNSGTETAPVIWPKYKETHHIEVRYYPPDRNTQQREAMDTGARLLETLRQITIKSQRQESLPIHATECTRKTVDDALVFSVNYKTEGYFYEDKAQTMGDLASKIEIKE